MPHLGLWFDGLTTNANKRRSLGLSFSSIEISPDPDSSEGLSKGCPSVKAEY